MVYLKNQLDETDPSSQGAARVIFFDIDGTLLDFKGAEYRAVAAFYRQYSELIRLELPQFYDRWCTVGKKHFGRFLASELTFEQQKIERMQELLREERRLVPDAQAGEMFQTYLSHFEDAWKPFDDVIPCLDRLREYDLGIISNGDPDQQRAKLRKLGILHYFGTIVTAGDAGAAKPDPRIFEFACSAASKSPSACFYVGDDWTTDIAPCARIGMKGIWLNRRGESGNGSGSAKGGHSDAIASLGELERRVKRGRR